MVRMVNLIMYIPSQLKKKNKFKKVHKISFIPRSSLGLKYIGHL